MDTDGLGRIIFNYHTNSAISSFGEWFIPVSNKNILMERVNRACRLRNGES
jgi:hypothetical protein